MTDSEKHPSQESEAAVIEVEAEEATPSQPVGKITRIGFALAVFSSILGLLMLTAGVYLWLELDYLKNRGAPSELLQLSESLQKLTKDAGDARNELAGLKGGFNELRELTNTRVDSVKTTTDSRLRQMEEKQQGEVNALSEKLAAARGTLTELSQQMQTTLGNLQAQQTKFEGRIQASVDAMDQELRRTREQRILDEVDHYILLAEQRIKIERDAQGAALALEAALSRVKQLKRAAWTALVAAMEKDVQALKAVEMPNINGYAQTLLELQAKLADIPLKGTDRRFAMGEAGRESEENQQQGYLDRMWDSVKSGLKMTVRIQKQGEPVTPLLSPEEGFFLYQNLRLKLEGARFALLRRDQGAYTDSLKAAQQWFAQYFTDQGEGSRLLKDSLQRLSQVNIAPPIPDIQQTRQLYRETQAGKTQTPRFGGL